MRSPFQTYRPPVHAGLDIAYQDNALIAVNKPGGLLSVPGRGEHKQDSMATRVQLEYPGALIVHRLDMHTSGLMVMARSPEIQRELGRLFEQRKVQKRYIALVTGLMEKNCGEIDLPLMPDWPNRPRQIVDCNNGKPARTLYEVLSRDDATNTTRVALMPVTGRTHQLRVHLQVIGHPIMGDQLYTGGCTAGISERLYLHAESLAFAHPVTKTPLDIRSTVPF